MTYDKEFEDWFNDEHVKGVLKRYAEELKGEA